MVVIGGEATSDLRDFWALNLETNTWFKPDVEHFDNFTPKRFHSASVIGDSKVITFGGCHSEYIHMNEVHIFDMASFIENPTDISKTVVCNRINVSEGVPSTRWGHAAATYGSKLYILGGRNEQDIIDLHEFDADEMKWREVEFNGVLPKARRRHSAVFVSGSLVMFGGFDGNFYNDLNICDFSRPAKQVLTI
jgi:N-acetylneuraminic acid mutarotase